MPALFRAGVCLVAVLLLSACDAFTSRTSRSLESQHNQTFELARSAEIRVAGRRANVRLPANAFVERDGSAASGRADATIQVFDPSRVLASGAGIESLRVTGESTEATLHPFGISRFEFSQHGEPLSLARGTEATISIALTDQALTGSGSQMPLAGDSLPLWHYDEQAHVWLREGEALVVDDPSSPSGLSAVGKVRHFSVWSVATAAPQTALQIELSLLSEIGRRDSNDEFVSYTVRVSLDDTVESWGLDPAGGAVQTEHTFTTRTGTVNIAGNRADRADLIVSESTVTDWTRIKLEITEVVVDRVVFPTNITRRLALNSNATNQIELTGVVLLGEELVQDAERVPTATNDTVDAQAGVPFAFDLCANDIIGGSSPIDIAVVGQPPAGLTVQNCVLTGSPRSPGVYDFDYRVKYAANGQSDLATVTIRVDGLDTDGDGVPNAIDLDDDNDGILDTVECAVVYDNVPLGGADGTFESLAGVASQDAFNSNVTGGGWLNSNGSADSWRAPVPRTGSSVWGGIADGTPASPDGGVIAGGGSWFTGGEAFYTTITGLDRNKNYNVVFYQANSGVEGRTPLNGLTAWRVVFGSETKYSAEMPYLGEGNQVWQKVEMTFRPTASTQRLEFFADSGSDGGVFDYMAIDGVEVLEPRTVNNNCDADGDGLTNDIDLDSDNDGINDVIESGGTDIGGDGMADDNDGNPANNDGIPSTAGRGRTPDDADGDGAGNPYELDSNNDGTNDIDDGGLSSLDLNGDGRVDAAADKDQDGIADVVDLRPDVFGDLGTDKSGLDTDSDGVPDTIDLDDDNDGVLDTVECEVQTKVIPVGGADGSFQSLVGLAHRSSPHWQSPKANDFVRGAGWDHRGGSPRVRHAPTPLVGSYWPWSQANGTPPSKNGGVYASAGTNYPDEGFYTTYTGLDTNSQYRVVFEQVNAGSSASTPPSSAARWKVVFGDETKYSPTLPHLGYLRQEWYDVTLTFQPTSSTQRLGFHANSPIGQYFEYMGIDGIRLEKIEVLGGFCDRDGDGISDELDLDSDNDGINDVDESGGIDNDGDGMADDLDGDSANNDGIPSTAGRGNTPRDSDGDLTPDMFEVDSNNDGTLDIFYARLSSLDADKDGRIDVADDADRDGIADSVDLLPNRFGDFGPDTDSDGVRDAVDLDDDNDGISDIVECDILTRSVPVTGPDGTFESIAQLAHDSSPHWESGKVNDTVVGGGWDHSGGTPRIWNAPTPLIGSYWPWGIANGTPPSNDGGVYAGAGTFYPDEGFITTYTGLDTNSDYLLVFEQVNAGVSASTPTPLESPDNRARWKVVFGDETLFSPAMPYLGILTQQWQDVRLTLSPTSSTQRLGFHANATIGSVYEYVGIDGIKLLKINSCDADGDGISNALDRDSDNDGIFDVSESGGIDANGDGRADDNDGDSTNNGGIPSTAGTGNLPADSNRNDVGDPYE